MKEHDYLTNKFGAKILLIYTKSFQTFTNESANLELFLTYILLAEHTDKEALKQTLITIYCDGQNNIMADKLKAFLSTNDEANEIFNIDYYEVYFGQMAYTRMADNALCYFKDILSEVVRKKPEILKSNDKESHEYILSFKSFDELIEDLIEKKIKQLFYGSINDIKKFFKDRLGINLFENEEIERSFHQFVQQRNLIVHNRGIISSEFVEEFKQFTVGHTIHFKYNNLSEINIFISNIIADIDIKLRKKFNLEIIEIK